MNVRLMKERLITRAQRGVSNEGVDDFFQLSIFSTQLCVHAPMGTTSVCHNDGEMEVQVCLLGVQCGEGMGGESTERDSI